MARAGSSKRLRTARGRTLSSSRWLQRQLKDPYVAAAKRAGYRSRAAWKLDEIDQRFKLLRPGARIADLGAAPGGWTQLAVERVRPNKTGGRVVAIDVASYEPVAEADCMIADITDPDTPARLRAALEGPADLVLSDMAAPATGHRNTDFMRSMVLCEAAFELAKALLAPGGALVVKSLMGGTEGELLNAFKRAFKTVKHFKPKASRSESAETYLVATGFKGAEQGGETTV